MKLSSRELCVRALNYWRSYHVETYVALRYLADAQIVHDRSEWLDALVSRRVQTRPDLRPFFFKRFKQRLGNGDFKYRDFTALSPMNALIEVWTLNQLAALPSFQTSNFVFSYQWPKDREPRIFRHFFNGYTARNRAIAAACDDNRDNVVVVADIEGFYPSISHSILQKRLDMALPLDAEIERAHFSHLLKCENMPKGIPIGPASSHVMANLVMGPVDATLSQAFPGSYFRYVDDIAIVVPRGQATATLALIESTLGQQELHLNNQKTDVVDGAMWSRHCPQFTQRRDTFETLLTTAALACAIDPEKVDVFADVCHDEGILLPEKRFSENSKSQRYRRWLYILRSQGILKAATAQRMDAFLFRECIRELRATLWGELRVLRDDSHLSASATTNKWDLQRKRYLLNRLFYITPIDQLAELLPYVDGNPDFMEMKALLTAVLTRNAESLLQFPGPAVSTFCGIADQVGRVTIPLGRLQSLTEANVAALSTLLLAGAVEVDLEALPVSGVNRRLLRFAATRPSPIRDNWRINYLDEIHSLQMGNNNRDTHRLLRTRYDWAEDVMLEALHVGGDAYYGA